MFKKIIFITLSLTYCLSAEEEKKPNIIFLLADDQSFYSVGAYGNQDVLTPHMDKLAKDGLIFDKHYNTTAICQASRANILTGMYEYKTRTNFDIPDMTEEIWNQSYPVLLRKEGYLTAFAGKFGIEVEGRTRGLPRADFDFWAGGFGQTSYNSKASKALLKYAEKYPHSTLAYGAFGRDVIKDSVAQKKPFCLSISFKAPHRPTTPDPQFDHIYKGKVFKKPENYGREHSKHLSEQSKRGRQYVRFEEWEYDKNYDKVMATYHQQVYAIDVALGMIREEVEAQGIADNTIIIYTSDNGFLCGSHGYGSKVLPLEESSRAPLIIYHPKAKTTGKVLRSSKLTANIDFAPTILKLAGASVPENMDGKSLLSLLDDEKDGGHEQISFMNTWGELATKSLTTITEKYKYTYWWYGDNTLEPAEDLFDVSKDPLELTNLSRNAEYQPLLDEMRAKYDEELQLWKEANTDHPQYSIYNVLFDRSIDMTAKNKLLGAKRKKKQKNK